MSERTALLSLQCFLHAQTHEHKLSLPVFFSLSNPFFTFLPLFLSTLSLSASLPISITDVLLPCFHHRPIQATRATTSRSPTVTMLHTSLGSQNVLSEVLEDMNSSQCALHVANSVDLPPPRATLRQSVLEGYPKAYCCKLTCYQIRMRLCVRVLRTERASISDIQAASL